MYTNLWLPWLAGQGEAAVVLVSFHGNQLHPSLDTYDKASLFHTKSVNTAGAGWRWGDWAGGAGEGETSPSAILPLHLSDTLHQKLI